MAEAPSPNREDNRLNDTTRTRKIADAMDVAFEQAKTGNADAVVRDQQMEIAGAAAGLTDAAGVEDADARRELALAASEQVVDRRAANHKLNTDELTGLANLRALRVALPRAEREPDMAVCYFDANDFGIINKLQEHGDRVGDEVIIEIAEALKQAAEEFNVSRGVFRTKDGAEPADAPDDRMVFRRGGDEFIVLCPKAHAAALIQRAEGIFGVRHFSGTRHMENGAVKTYKDLAVTLSGADGDTFDEARAKIQNVKSQRKTAEAA